MVIAMVCGGVLMAAVLALDIAKEPIQQWLDRLAHAHEWLVGEWYAGYAED